MCPVMVSDARMPWMAPSSATFSRALSTPETRAETGNLAASIWISVNLRSNWERSSGWVEAVTVSTTPRTLAPARGFAMTTASTGSPDLEV